LGSCDFSGSGFHSYDQLLRAAQTKEMLQHIISEGMIKLDKINFEIDDDRIADETADIIGGGESDEDR
jgi:hypothetical protein